MDIHKLRCSFCGKKAVEVSKLVAGPRIFISRIYICDECVALITQIMDGEAHPDKMISAKSGSFFARLKAKWDLVFFARAMHLPAPDSGS